MSLIKKLLCQFLGQCGETSEARQIREEINRRLDRLEMMMGVTARREWRPRDPFGL